MPSALAQLFAFPGAQGTAANGMVLDRIGWAGMFPAGLANTGTVLDRSSIRVDSAAVNRPDFEVSLQGHRGHDYQLQVRNDASSGVWQNIGGRIDGAGGPITLTDSGGASGQQRYYRVAVD